MRRAETIKDEINDLTEQLVWHREQAESIPKRLEELEEELEIAELG